MFRKAAAHAGTCLANAAAAAVLLLGLRTLAGGTCNQSACELLHWHQTGTILEPAPSCPPLAM